jgi:hypothetical protein
MKAILSVVIYVGLVLALGLVTALTASREEVDWDWAEDR